jgi:chaperonin GroEL (HSP60 family)
VLITRGIEKTAKALVAELKLMSKEVKSFSCFFMYVYAFLLHVLWVPQTSHFFAYSGVFIA